MDNCRYKCEGYCKYIPACSRLCIGKTLELSSQMNKSLKQERNTICIEYIVQ